MAEELKTKVISFFGPPGSGKGTIAHRCEQELGYRRLSTGDLIRGHIQEQTDLGKDLQSYVSRGHLVPDDLIVQMVLVWLRGQIEPGKTIILDGFPRTRGQADLLLSELSENSEFSDIAFSVINFDLSEAEIIKRISSRLVCSNKKCQEVYSTLVKMPRNPGICDVCDSPVLRRPDDEADVVRERLNVFAKFKNDLLSFYKESNQRVTKFSVPVGDPEVVFSAFTKML